MNREDRELLEKMDLTFLHTMKNTKKSINLQNVKLPSHEVAFGMDLWTRALSMMEGNRDEILNMRSEIMRSKLSKEAKIWWDTIFAIRLHAPLEELTQLSQKHNDAEFSNKCSRACLIGAAAKRAEQARIDEVNYRASVEQRENARLQELEEDVIASEMRLNQAKEEYTAYRKSGLY